MLFLNKSPTAQNQNFSMQWISQNVIHNRDTRATAQYASSDEPRIVFFPANREASSTNVCQDEVSSKGQTGFNTFAFLSFALTIFNAMRYIFFILIIKNSYMQLNIYIYIYICIIISIFI